MKALALCANGCGVPPCPPSLVICRRCLDKIRSQLARAAGYSADGADTEPRSGDASKQNAKPEAFLDLVERVSPAPRVELFARRNRLGWDTWGHDALNHVDLASAALASRPPAAKDNDDDA